MNENEFSLDISAEKQIFSVALTPSELKQSELQSVQSSSNLPESIQLSSENQPKVPLPEPIILNATPIKTDVVPAAEVSKVSVGLDIKFDAQASYNKLSQKVETLESNMISSEERNMQQSLPYPRAQNKFEEKPTTEPTNLIFETRVLKFAKTPMWS